MDGWQTKLPVNVEVVVEIDSLGGVAELRWSGQFSAELVEPLAT
jgi:hypothetical protein